MARFETSVGIDDLVGKFDKHSRITMRRKAWKYPDGRIFFMELYHRWRAQLSDPKPHKQFLPFVRAVMMQEQ